MEKEMIDYAYPALMAEKALAKLHDAMLLKDHAKAREAALECIVECKIAYHSILVMEESSVRKTSASA